MTFEICICSFLALQAVEPADDGHQVKAAIKELLDLKVGEKPFAAEYMIRLPDMPSVAGGGPHCKVLEIGRGIFRRGCSRPFLIKNSSKRWKIIFRVLG